MAPVLQPETSGNKLDFVPRVSFLPFEWRSLGAALSSSNAESQTVSGRCSFVVRQGYDPLDQATTGNVVEGHADLGVAVKVKTFALALTAGNLRFRTGLDNPLQQQVALVGDDTIPSLKVTAAKEYGDGGDSYVAFAYDIKQQRPEVSLAWAGEARNDRATVLLKADPVLRTLTVGAALSTPGPEWRKIFYDEATETLDIPRDDGERHTVWVSHTARSKDLLAATRVGARLSLHRALNWIGDFVDYNLEERIPTFVWRLPFSETLYKLLIPQEDDDEQIRYRLKGWELEAVHDFARKRPTLALNKRLGKLGTVSASYDLQTQDAGLSVARNGLSVGMKVGRLEGLGWSKPSIHVYVEPLNLLL